MRNRDGVGGPLVSPPRMSLLDILVSGLLSSRWSSSPARRMQASRL